MKKWELKRGTLGNIYLTEGDSAVVATLTGKWENGKAMARARLMVAAPELLAACQAVLDTPFGSDPTAVQAADNLVRQALKKAGHAPAV
jgi:hypothetical protein